MSNLPAPTTNLSNTGSDTGSDTSLQGFRQLPSRWKPDESSNSESVHSISNTISSLSQASQTSKQTGSTALLLNTTQNTTQNPTENTTEHTTTENTNIKLYNEGEKNIYQYYKENIHLISNKDILHKILFFVILLSIIDDEDTKNKEKLLSNRNEDVKKFVNDIENVFVYMSKYPNKFQSFLIRVDNTATANANKYNINVNLQKRLSDLSKKYRYFYESDKENIIQRKIITVLINLIFEYISHFDNVPKNKKEFLKCARNGYTTIYSRFLSFSFAFYSISSDCSSLTDCLDKCNQQIGCSSYKGPKQSGCRKKYTGDSTTFFDPNKYDKIKNIPDSDLIQFHKTLNNIAVVLMGKLNRKISKYQGKEQDEILGIFEKYLVKVMSISKILQDIQNKFNK